jgi:hypothetical protein
MDRDLGYKLTLKEIDMHAKYEPLALCGLSGLGIDKMQNLIQSGTLKTDEQRRVNGEDFLNWVDTNDLPVANQS